MLSWEGDISTGKPKKRLAVKAMKPREENKVASARKGSWFSNAVMGRRHLNRKTKKAIGSQGNEAKGSKERSQWNKGIAKRTAR